MIVTGVVALTQLVLLGLLVLLALRVITLSRQSSFTCASPGAFCESPVNTFRETSGQAAANASHSRDHTGLFTQLHILAGLQEKDCKVKGLTLAEAPRAVKDYATAWLYGAGCALCEHRDRHTGPLAEIVAGIISRKTVLPQGNAMATINELTRCPVLLACYRAGLEGAGFWQEKQYVPERDSLYEAITVNAFI